MQDTKSTEEPCLEAGERASSPRCKRSEESILFEKLWPEITDDNRLTLFGFRRFRTTHLLNLRYLEDEIEQTNKQVYQAGLSLGISATGQNRLGLRHSKPELSGHGPEIFDRALVLKMRQLLKDYGIVKFFRGPESKLIGSLSKDEALAAFNQVMLMETFSLADNRWGSSLWGYFNSYEAYKTRLARVDLPIRTNSRDILRHYLRKGLRALWFSVRFGRLKSSDSSQCQPSTSDPELVSSDQKWSSQKRSFQNTALLTDFLTRFIVAITSGAFLVVPLVVLSVQRSHATQIALISVFIVLFCALVSLLSKASNQEIMAASAAYAAVLVVFIAVSPAP